MDKTNNNPAGSWTKEVAGLSKATAGIMSAATKVREARTTLELLKEAKAKAAADDPDYIINDPEALDARIGDLYTLEVLLCSQALGIMEAHKDTGDDLV